MATKVRPLVAVIYIELHHSTIVLTLFTIRQLFGGAYARTYRKSH